MPIVFLQQNKKGQTIENSMYIQVTRKQLTMPVLEKSDCVTSVAYKRTEISWSSRCTE